MGGSTAELVEHHAEQRQRGVEFEKRGRPAVKMAAKPAEASPRMSGLSSPHNTGINTKTGKPLCDRKLRPRPDGVSQRPSWCQILGHTSPTACASN